MSCTAGGQALRAGAHRLHDASTDNHTSRTPDQHAASTADSVARPRIRTDPTGSGSSALGGDSTCVIAVESPPSALEPDPVGSVRMRGLATESAVLAAC